jgi:hypothetical protein
MNERKLILDNNAALRQGEGVRRLEDGEVTFRIPTGDMKVLQVIYPELVCKDHGVRLAAWKKFRSEPAAQKYLVVRTPRQVKNSQRGIIIK